MAMISPSILAADFSELGRDIRDIERNGSDWVHVDVMDGVFVPNISIGVPVVKSIRPVTGLPLDVHLMITEPIRYIETFAKVGADWITFHIEADTQEKDLECIRLIHSLGLKAGISLKPGTPVEAALPYLSEVDMVLVMTVEPGFGGQKFMADMMPKLRRLRQLRDQNGWSWHIQVDGGVDAVTAPICKENGADVLVAGSAYFKAPDRAAFVRMIQE